MLGKEKIVEAMNNQEIEVSISFCYEENELKLCDPEQSLLESSLKDNLYSDRLKLTMGPIIKILNRKRISRRYRFKERRNYYDLRASDNKYIINPGESIIILTNERIKLNGKYACIIIPRISLSDVGVVVTTAYVDPFYHGVMRLQLSNLSDKAYELSTLEAIAQCFFFELSESVSEEYKEYFSTKSVFFGQTWKGILNSDRNPFPTKKQSASVEKFPNLKNQLNTIWDFIKRHSLIFLLFSNLFIIICGVATVKQEMDKYVKSMEHLESILEPISTEIVVEPGEIYGEKEIIVGYAKSDIVSVLCNNDEIHYKILSGDVGNETKITFYIYRSSTLPDKYEVNFTYTIVRRIQ